jgi:CRISPR-associated autoregulator DevR family
VTNIPTTIYELGLSYRAIWQAHSQSNAGSNGSNRLMPRRQLLADGTETDACSGNIAKHYHAELMAEYAAEACIPLCTACQQRSSRRAAALVGHPEYPSLTMDDILMNCGLCDVHGFLVTGKNAAQDGSTEARQRLSKHSLVEYAFALALPEQHTETPQLFTRIGDSKDAGQMLMKMPSRSGAYAQAVRYKAAGIGVDTDKWRVVVTDTDQRQRRHRSALSALRDLVLSPSGALTAKMLPHLTGLVGVMTIRTSVGRAPIYSALASDFVEQLTGTASDACIVLPFASVSEFAGLMNDIIERTAPALPAAFRNTPEAAI